MCVYTQMAKKADPSILEQFAIFAREQQHAQQASGAGSSGAGTRGAAVNLVSTGSPPSLSDLHSLYLKHPISIAVIEASIRFLLTVLARTWQSMHLWAEVPAGRGTCGQRYVHGSCIYAYNS